VIVKVREKSDEEVVGPQLDEMMALADRAWRDQLEDAALADEAMARTWQLERARVAARFGETSDRARAAEALATLHIESRAALEAERDRLKLPSPRPQPHAVVLHGRVADPTGAPLAGLTVRLVDDVGETKASGRTAEDGRFRVTLRLERETPLVVEIDSPQGGLLHEDDQRTLAGPGGMLYREITVDLEGAARSARRKGGARSRPAGRKKR
jgi:hypothetical protein